MIKLGIVGACGKMGARIVQLAKQDPGLKVTVALEQKNHPKIGSRIDEAIVTADYTEIHNCDCLIDFTVAEATRDFIDIAKEYKKPLVIGTTGLDEKDRMKLGELAKTFPIVYSPNMSVGVNILFKLVKEAAELLKDYNVNIIEAHHIHKKDAPSGTAKKLAEIINRSDVPIAPIREGEIVGDHRVIFESEVDKIELFHSAKTRDIFAQGALLAAKFVVNKKTGLFDMQDVLASK